MTEKLTKRERTREKILEAAGRNFRRYGYAGTGVDGIAEAAGVTSGALYAHFGSKDLAFVAALERGLDEVIDAIPVFQRDHGDQWVVAFADYYLGADHRQDLDCGCAMTTLSPEVVRRDHSLHAVYEEKMTIIVAQIARGLSPPSEEKAVDDREGRGWALLSTLIGGLTVSRAVADSDLAALIAASVRGAAIAAAGEVAPSKDA
ncbi:HTH-type transcriptional regulator MtrR [Rhodobiaceae bacterium]|nr:HTH-type transcriptional regulator MtrR [Rhodobiaceae bacterium]